jgi:hypothetical protein
MEGIDPLRGGTKEGRSGATPKVLKRDGDKKMFKFYNKKEKLILCQSRGKLILMRLIDWMKKELMYEP